MASLAHGLLRMPQGGQGIPGLLQRLSGLYYIFTDLSVCLSLPFYKDTVLLDQGPPSSGRVSSGPNCNNPAAIKVTFGGPGKERELGGHASTQDTSPPELDTPTRVSQSCCPSGPVPGCAAELLQGKGVFQRKCPSEMQMERSPRFVSGV